MRSSIFGLALLSLAITAANTPARAAFIAQFAQVGPDVVITGSGSINITGAVQAFSGIAVPQIRPTTGLLYIGSGSVIGFEGSSGPNSFGTGVDAFPTSSSGGAVIFDNGEYVVPAGYVSGFFLSDTSTYANETFASLGLTPGTYVYQLPNDTLTIEIPSVSSVPLPASAPMFSAALLTLGAIGYGVKRKAKTA